MHFDDLLKEFPVNSFPKSGETVHPEKAVVLNAREMVGAAIKNDDFICDCIALEVDHLKSNKISAGLSPFYIIPGLGIQFALGYWQPGSSAGAHEHTAWTITAVCTNKLEVITYDRDKTYKTNSLVPKRRFEGLSGMAGYIYEPCIHNPINPTKSWSLSFHISSPLDGLRPVDYPDTLTCLTGDYEINLALAAHPYLKVTAARHKLTYADQLVKKLLTINTAKARSTLIKCLDICSIRTRNELKDYLGRYIIENFTNKVSLEITDPKLALQCHCEKNMVILSALTPKALVQELSVSIIAKEAILFAVHQRAFDTERLPGGLTKHEQLALAEVLEETGLFKRINN